MMFRVEWMGGEKDRACALCLAGPVRECCQGFRRLRVLFSYRAGRLRRRRRRISLAPATRRGGEPTFCCFAPKKSLTASQVRSIANIRADNMI